MTIRLINESKGLVGFFHDDDKNDDYDYKVKDDHIDKTKVRTRFLLDLMDYLVFARNVVFLRETGVYYDKYELVN